MNFGLGNAKFLRASSGCGVLDHNYYRSLELYQLVRTSDSRDFAVS